MKLSTIADFHQKHKSILQPLLFIFLFIFINVVIPQLMNVMYVNTSSYINYLLFVNAMLVFYLLLPRRLTRFD